MKVGLIRCMQTEDYCPSTVCLKFAKEGRGGFEGGHDIEVIAVNTCGGCPGKKAVFRAKEMVKRGADTIAFASCINKGTPIGFICPNGEKMKEAVSRAVGGEVKIIEYTH